MTTTTTVGDPRPPWRTLANALTALRFLVAPACALAIRDGQVHVALGLFIVAATTDVLDGRIARQRGQASARGALLDHTTDAWLVCLCLSAIPAVPLALPALIAVAFTQYALDSRVLLGQPLRASWLGRRNGIAYWVLVGTPIVRDGLSLGWPDDAIVTLLSGVLLVSTLISMGDRAVAWLGTRHPPATHSTLKTTATAKPMTTNESPQADGPQPKKPSRAVQLVSWALALGCFYLVFGRIEAAASRQSQTPIEYLRVFFGEANWLQWLCLMVPYSVFFFLVDAHASWRVIRWYNVPAIRYRDVLPIRASAYILSVVNEQVGKGAMSLYLWRRHRVPAWEAVSSMILLGMVEIYQLLLLSSIGTLLYFELVGQASSQLPLTTLLPAVYGLALLYLPIHLLYFAGRIFPGSQLRQARVLHTLRRARPREYLWILLFKLPNLLMAVVVYTTALGLFNVEIAFGQMLAFLPVIFLASALPLPFHAGALLLWTVLFPEYPEVGAFSLVMHTFFVAFNAVIGLAFLPRANRELLAGQGDGRADSPDSQDSPQLQPQDPP